MSGEVEDTGAKVLREALSRHLFGEVEEPTRIGRFAALRVLGSGGMGRVFAAYDDRLDRRIAVKVLLRDVDVQEERVLREAKAMAKVSHPNVVQVYEVGEHDGRLFIAMEFIEGETLDVWQAAQGRGWRDVLAAYVQAAQGLSAAHRAGLIHRDFKPNNVMVDTDPEGELRVRVLDFGLVRLAEDSPSLNDAGETTANSGDDKLTRTGKLLGTPAYMAPEQFDGAEVTEAADQFSFCVALWEGLYGERPFAGRTTPQIATAVATGDLRTPPAGTDVPGWLHAIIARGLSAEPNERFESMSALGDALRRDPAKLRTRWLSVVGGLAAFGLAGVGTWTWVQARAERCSGATEQLAGVWDETRRNEVQAAMHRTELSYADVAWKSTAAQLDRYAQAWTDMHKDNCEATTFRREQSDAVMDLRMACLHRARVGLVAVTNVLADADPKVVDNATRVLGALRPLSRCADVDALQEDVEPPLPAEADAVAEIFALLAEARALHQAGRYSDAQQRVADARERLVGLTYEPVRTSVAYEEAWVLEALGDYEAAEASLRESLGQAAKSQQWSEMRQAASLLMNVVGYRQKRVAEALQHRYVAEGLTQGDPAREADFRNNLALVLQTDGRYEAAAVEYRRALDLRLELLGPDHPIVASSRNNVGVALLKQGKFADAEAELRSVIELRERILGAEHPHVAASRNNLANALVEQGKLAEGSEQIRRAVEIKEASLGTEHPTAAGWRSNLGATLFFQGRYAEAEVEHRRALDVLLKTVGPEHTHVAHARSGLADALYGQGRYEDAEQEHRVALAIHEKAFGPDHPRVASSRSAIGSTLYAQKRYAEAVSEYRAAVAIEAEALDPEHPHLAQTRDSLGAALNAQGEHAEAEPLHRLALAALLKAFGDDHPRVATARTNLAATLLERNRPGEALPLAEQAWAQLDDPQTRPAERAHAAFVLARALWDKGSDRARAKTLAQQALDDSDEAQEVRAWLDSRRAGD